MIRFKFGIIMLLLVFTTAAAQAVEIVVTLADIEIRFPDASDPGWINGAETEQPYFSVDSIVYSPEAVSTSLTHTTKLNEPETWEAGLFQPLGEPFRKVIFIITIHEARAKEFELRMRNRYYGAEEAGPFSDPSDRDRIIGKPEKPVHNK